MHHWSEKFNIAKHFLGDRKFPNFVCVFFGWSTIPGKKNKEIMLLYWTHGHWKDLFNARDNTDTHNTNYTPKLYSRMDYRSKWLKQWQLYSIRVFESHKCNKVNTSQELTRTEFQILSFLSFCTRCVKTISCLLVYSIAHNMKCQDDSDRYDKWNVLEKWYDCNFI